jgi:hypothetical protein
MYEYKINLLKKHMKSKRSHPMEAIKHLFGKQIVCGSMLSLHALLLAGNCQGSGMVLQPYKAGTEGQQIDALTQTQKQAASAGVLAQNQTQPKTQTQTQPKKPQAKTEARDALAQAQKQTETAWTSSLARMQQNQDNLIRIVGETLNTLLNNAFLSKQTEVLSVTGQSAGKSTSVTGQSAGKSTSVTGQSAGQSTHSNSNNSVPTQDPSKTQQLSASIVDVPPPPPSQKTSSENSIRKSEFQPPSKTPFLIELEEAVEKKRLRLELNAKLNKDDPPKTEDQKTEDQKTEDMPLVSSIA